MQSKKLCTRGGSGGGDGGLSLPEDIIYEVLLRQPLPPMAMRRFQSVCKGWRALLSDPAFIAARRSSRACAADPLIAATFGSMPELELRLLDMDGNVLRVFDVRGEKAALLAPTRLDLVFVDMMELGGVVIDPASGHAFAVVGTREPPPPWLEAGAKLKSTIVDDYSFGRAVPSGDYKVLRLHVAEILSRRDGRRERSQWCEVGTIRDDDGAETTWRPRPWGPLSQTSFSCENKTTIDGGLYFLYYSTSLGKDLIATFNLESEEWKAKTIKGPPSLRRKKDYEEYHITLTELKGSLCMIHNVQGPDDFGGHYVNIWLLKDSNWSVWAKEYKIEMPEALLFTKPLDVLLDGRLFLLNKFREKAGNNEKCHRYILQFYNYGTKTFTDFMEMPDGFNGRMAFYTGSLQA